MGLHGLSCEELPKVHSVLCEESDTLKVGSSKMQKFCEKLGPSWHILNTL